jgi:hypothetical protein
MSKCQKNIVSDVLDYNTDLKQNDDYYFYLPVMLNLLITLYLH